MEFGITFTTNFKGYSFANFKGVRGYLNQNDCRQLISHAKALPENSRYAETGTFLGCSSHLIAAHSNATVWAHDIWSIDEEENSCEFPSECFFSFYESIKQNNLETRIIPVAGNSLKTIKIHDDNSLDLAFVDGDHTYDGAIGDLRNVLPKMKKGATILAHDCTPGSDCIRAMTEFTSETGQTYEILPGTCGMAKIVVV
jgi:predicted O-methyltransferase YrrM